MKVVFYEFNSKNLQNREIYDPLFINYKRIGAR